MPAAPASLAEALRDRYVFERELGRGGMATVYLARDLQHDRLVALKLLSPELAATLGSERFLREIKVAARLQHPHILPVFDSGEFAGQLWYTMPYVEGESLRDRLEREGSLPVHVATRIAREVALALDCAHRHGVVHRDVKPENILLSEDQALLADFGIAKGPSLDGERLTGTGLAIGSPTYMSPEQASGDPHVDHRTDIYSLGCVLYEMLAGTAPFAGPTPQSVIAQRLTIPAPHIRLIRPAVPESIESAVQKALALVPADRFATAAEFGEALSAAEQGLIKSARPARSEGLRRAALLVPLILLGLGAILLARRAGRPAEQTPGARQPIAVLPFENLGSPDDDYFTDGVSDAVRGKLAALSGLQVIARGSSIPYKRTRKALEQIGRELGVQYVLTATVRWDKGKTGGVSRVQVSPELVQVAGVSTPTTRWQQSFDAVISDVFQVQSDIASRVAMAFDVAVGARERRLLEARPTQNLVAYDAFLQGEQAADGLATVQPSAVRRAVAAYGRAISADSTFMPAWAQLSRALSLLYYFAEPSEEVGRRARQAAERAIDLAPERPEGWVALGDLAANITKDPAQALTYYARARHLSPAGADLLTATAFAERILGQWDSSVAHLRAAHALDPRSVHPARRLAETLILLRRYPEALVVCEKGLALAPHNLSLIQDKALVYVAQGDLGGARAWIRLARRLVGPDAVAAFFGAYGELYWVLEEEDQRRLLRLPPHAFDTRGSWAQVLAQTHALRGDSARAQAYADSALAEAQASCRGDAQCHALKAVQLALAGRRAEAIAEGKAGMQLAPITKDAFMGPYVQHQLARVYLLSGEPEKALDLVQVLLSVPYVLSPGYLKVDPGFASVRNNQRFQRFLKQGD
jgi:TolB-like protein